MSAKITDLSTRFDEFISYLDPTRPTRIRDLSHDMGLRWVDISELCAMAYTKGISLVNEREDGHRAIQVEPQSRKQVDAIAERFLK